MVWSTSISRRRSCNGRVSRTRPAASGKRPTCSGGGGSISIPTPRSRCSGSTATFPRRPSCSRGGVRRRRSTCSVPAGTSPTSSPTCGPAPSSCSTPTPIFRSMPWCATTTMRSGPPSPRPGSRRPTGTTSPRRCPRPRTRPSRRWPTVSRWCHAPTTPPGVTPWWSAAARTSPSGSLNARSTGPISTSRCTRPTARSLRTACSGPTR